MSDGQDPNDLPTLTYKVEVRMKYIGDDEDGDSMYDMEANTGVIRHDYDVPPQSALAAAISCAEESLVELKRTYINLYGELDYKCESIQTSETVVIPRAVENGSDE